MTAAIIGLLAGLVALATWWFKRKRSPTRNERLDDLEREIGALQVQIKHCRARGDHAAADACMRLLRLKSAEHLGVACRKCRADQPASGNADPGPEKGDR